MKYSTILGLVASVVTISYMAAIGVKASQNEFIVGEIMRQQADANCLALNVYFEARGESMLAQKAVAWVTLNRVAHKDYPDTVCEVVWQDGQFSWTDDGNSDKPKDQEAYQLAIQAAWSVLLEQRYDLYDPTEGSTMFHAHYVEPEWTDSYEVTSRIDKHIFYKDEM